MSQPRRYYKWFYDHVHSRQYDLLLRWLLLPFGGEKRFRRQMMANVDFAPGERVLDLCCGTGASTLAILKRTPGLSLVVGADLSVGQLRQAKLKLASRGVPLVEADAAHAPFAAACFDTVVIPHALHEMPRQTRLAALREARRLLRNTGKLVALELDDPPTLGRRLLLAAWLGYWLPYPINFENPTRRDMLRHGLQAAVAEAGFSRTRKIPMFKGAMQVVFGWP
jgi:demethylmenaquinone methyltransferase/2-methoxy-6-polyprenyl-1,4-benzoquinol methylase